MVNRLAGKAVLLAGLGPIFGRAAAVLFAQEGARLALASRTGEEARRVAHFIRASGGDALTLEGDVTQPDDARRIVREAALAFGGLNVLVNVAGNYWWRTATFAEMPPQYFDEALANNLRGVVVCSQAALPFFDRAGAGTILNFGSATKTRLDGSAVYSAAKLGVLGLTQAMARELRPRNVRVNCLCPGFMRAAAALGPIAPAAGPLTRQGRGEDVAYAALYLVSDEAGWVTGQTLTVDGGDEVLAGQAYEDW